MSDKPWVKFYASDWLAGTRAMSLAERGLYITLIAMMYDEQGPVKGTDERLGRLCGCTTITFRKTLDALVEDGKFTVSERGIFHKRVEKELKKIAEKSEKQSAVAKSRWSKNADNSTGQECHGMNLVMPDQCPPEARSQKPEGTPSLRSGVPHADDRIPKAGAPKKKSRIPDHFVPNETGRAKAKEVGMDREIFLAELDQFKSHHEANGSLMADWDAAWRTWCGKFQSFRARAAPARGSPPRPSPHDQIGDFERMMRGEPDHDGPTIDNRTYSRGRDDRREAVPMLPGLPE